MPMSNGTREELNGKLMAAGQAELQQCYLGTVAERTRLGTQTERLRSRLVVWHMVFHPKKESGAEGMGSAGEQKPGHIKVVSNPLAQGGQAVPTFWSLSTEMWQPQSFSKYSLALHFLNDSLNAMKEKSLGG